MMGSNAPPPPPPPPPKKNSKGGGAGGQGGLLPPKYRGGGGSAPLRYHQVMNNLSYCERVFSEIAVLPVTVSLNRFKSRKPDLLNDRYTMD